MSGDVVDGLVVVDKPPDWTSHDVVARVRRIAGIRRVGHAGTLDPMATGVLVLGLGRGTRLLGHLTLRDKAYDATIRLGQTTVTDDAQGELTGEVSAARVGEDAISAAVIDLTGELHQVPAAVSAVKVDGERAYRRVRAGERVDLAPRAVTVSRFAVLAVHRSGDVLDIDVQVTCSSGTYVRALARDLGAALGVGGHLTVLRRTRVGPYHLDMARPVEALERDLAALPLAAAVAAAFPRRELTAEEAGRVSHGAQLPAVGLGPGPVGVFAPDGTVVALVEERAGLARPLAVFW